MVEFSYEPLANLPKVEGSENPPIGGIKGSASECLSDQAANLPVETVPAPVCQSRQVGDSAVPPASLPEDIAAEWRQIAADLRDRRLWKESMGGLVTSYVLAQATALRLELQIALEGASVAGAGGALKPHPATGLLRSSRETVARLGAELGLTPTSRSRKSLQPAGQGTLFDKNPFDL